MVEPTRIQTFFSQQEGKTGMSSPKTNILDNLYRICLMPNPKINILKKPCRIYLNI